MAVCSKCRLNQDPLCFLHIYWYCWWRCFLLNVVICTSTLQEATEPLWFKLVPRKLPGRLQVTHVWDNMSSVTYHMRREMRWFCVFGAFAYLDLFSPFQSRQALSEVESLLDHLFEHPNTAPFISYRLIQRLVTSNPSRAYVKDVADAFKTGKYKGKLVCMS